MKPESKKYLSGFAALAGLFVIGSLMRSPESQAKGAFSSPVTVMNTTANPGSVLDADKATRIPYQSRAVVTTCTGAAGCVFSFTAVPAGYRLVVENVSGHLVLATGTTTPPIARLEESSNNAVWGFSGTIGQSIGGNVFAAFNGNIRGFFDSSDGQIIVVVVANYPSVATTESVTVSGYLENCAVVSCPAIQR